jgi:hypothetical protein
VLSLAKRGVHAIFTYNSNRAEAEKVVGLVGKTGQKAVALELDAGNVGTFDNFVEKVRRSAVWGPCGSTISCARAAYLQAFRSKVRRSDLTTTQTRQSAGENLGEGYCNCPGTHVPPAAEGLISTLNAKTPKHKSP